MKYNYKVFLYKNGQKSTDLSRYLTIPIFIEDRLNEELDTGEIILDNMPISTKFNFPPKTKIRIERYVDYILQKKWDMIVEHDDVEEYVGVPELCCHRIHLIEPSAIAQGMHIDNISLTYELQDVTLNYKTYNEDESILNDSVGVYPGGSTIPNKQPKSPSSKLDYSINMGGGQVSSGIVVGGGNYNYFINSFRYEWSNVDSLRSLKKKIAGTNNTLITFTIPTLICFVSNADGVFKSAFEMNTITRIYRTKKISGNLVGERELVLEKESGATSFSSSIDSSIYIVNSNKIYIRKIERWNRSDYSKKESFSDHYTYGDSIAHASSNFNDKTISFEIEALTDDELDNSDNGYYYEIECAVKPDNIAEFISKYYYSCSAEQRTTSLVPQIDRYYINYLNSYVDFLNPNDISVNANFEFVNPYTDVESQQFLAKGKKYSCYDLLRKALLTVDTQVIDNDYMGIDDIEYFIKVDNYWLNKLKNTTVYETTFEQKNLWEVMLQIGHYLHAIPYLEFAEAEDRFVLNFRQLGGNEKKEDTNTKITIFNSQNLSDYFTQYDSYITNLFSPQNLIDEYIVVKTEDSSYLVSNNTAILKTSYNISEIVEFEIEYNGETKSALEYIFEKSIYDILTSDWRVTPSKGNSLFFTLGDNKISGLNFRPPTRDNNGFMALKSIVAVLFENVNRNTLKFNDLKFHIKYRTQDSIRLTQFRPDLEKFIKNSSFEKYPHHEQFYGQQDKIVDSEKMSLNLFGKLIQLGNNICQRQESVNVVDDEKESGDLVVINGEQYYVTIVENEFYPSATFQKVTYSKNYNQLSQIVTIPSEPRFYEVSEKSKVRREVRLVEFFKISNKIELERYSRPRFFNSNNRDENNNFNYSSWASLLNKIIFNNEEWLKNVKIPNFAFVRFACDKKRKHTGSQGEKIDFNKMFPSSEIDRSNENNIRPKNSSDHADVIVPVLHFPLKDGMLFEFDMEDNFKAGDFIDRDIKETTEVELADDAYYAMQSVRYCDIMGRAELCKLHLFNKSDFSLGEMQDLPKGIYVPTEGESFTYFPNSKFIALEKDCREAISFNIQISLLHQKDDYGDDFVTFPNLFGEKESPLYCALLNKEISLFDNRIDFDTSLISNIEYRALISTILDFKGGKDYHASIDIEFIDPVNIDLSLVKSIVFYQQTESGVVPYLAKNVGNAPNDKKLQSLAIYPVFND